MTIINKSTLLFNKYKDGLSRGLKQDYNEDSREFRRFAFVNSNKPTVTESRDIFKNNTEDEDNKVVLENPFYLKYLKNPTKNTIVLAINKVLTDEPEKFNEIIVEVGSLYNNFLTLNEGKHEYADIMIEMLENSHDISTKQNIIDVFSNGINQNTSKINGSESAFSRLIEYNSKFREFVINNSNDIYVPLKEQTKNGISAYIKIKNLIENNTSEQLLKEENLNNFLNEYQTLQDTHIFSYDFAKEIFEQSKIKNIKSALSKAYDDFIFKRIEEKYLKNDNYCNYNILVERVLNDDLHNGFDELKNFVNKLEQHLLDNNDKIRTTVIFDLYDFLKKKYIVKEVDGKREAINLINSTLDETYPVQGLIPRKIFLDLLTRKPFEYTEDYFELKLAKEFYHELEGNEDFANKIIEQSGFTYVYNEDEDFYQPEDLKLTLAYIKNPTDDMIIKALDKCSYNIIYVMNDTDKPEIKQHKKELLFDYLRNNSNKDENSKKSKFSLEELYMTGGFIYGLNYEDNEDGKEELLLIHTEISKLNKILDELPVDIKAQAIRETVNMDFMKIKSHEFHNNEIIDAFYDNYKAIAYVDLYVNHQSLTEQYVYERHEREARSDNNFNWRTALIQPNTELVFGNSKVNKFDDVYQMRFIEKIKEDISNNNIEKDFEYYKTTELLKHISFKNIDNEFIEKCLSVSKPEIILETLSRKYEEHNGKRKYFELSDEQQEMILNKSFELVHYINNPSINTLLKIAEISFNSLTLDKNKDEYSKLNELIINELKRYDYKDGTTNDFIDIIVVDFPSEYAIQFMKEIEDNPNYSNKEKNKIINQFIKSSIKNENIEILNEFKDRLEIEETKEKLTELTGFTINLKM